MTALSHTTAALLAAIRLLLPLNLLFAAWALWHGQWLGVVLMLWLALLHVRADFDRRVFAAWACGESTPQDFDLGLQTLGLSRNKGGRSMEARCRGAMRLCAQILIATVLQFVCWLAD